MGNLAHQLQDSSISVSHSSDEGSKIFGDPKIRALKLERFLGSVLSIANAYFENPITEESLYGE